MPDQPVLYRIVPARPEAHLFRVSCTVASPHPAGQGFALPAWSPGSYLVRDYARHVVSISAECRGRPVKIDPLDKHSWRCAPCDGPLRVYYEVYAWDLSVRGAHLDPTHGFFNGPSVFLRALGHEGMPCGVDIAPPPRIRSWRVATSLRRKGAKAYGFGTYRADNYDELIDHPVEMGQFTVARFRAAGVPHEFVLSGRHRADMKRIALDLKKVCERQIRFFGTSAPMDRYVFLGTALGEGYGGLEHRASTALIFSRNDLPQAGTRGQPKAEERYRRFLGLCSHEYFHTWNVKRIKPAAFTPYDLDRENYTTLLWAFEGLTSYYDDLMLARSGLMERKDYLETLARAITDYLRMPGRRRQSVAESSFHAWTKYYKQDENSPNAIVSYYGKGSLVGLCLDLHIRNATRGAKSLDDVMRALWRRHGMTGRGVEEDGVERVAEEVTGLKLGRQFQEWVRGTSPLPLKELLGTHGVEFALRAPESAEDKGGSEGKAKVERMSIGARTRAEGKDVLLTHVLEGGAAQAAGLSAGDVIVAVDGVRIGNAGLDALLSSHEPGSALKVHAFRRDELLEFEVRLKRAERDTCVLSEARGRNPLLEKWLHA
jgi:predicted metalloprotease with PDZ domain